MRSIGLVDTVFTAFPIDIRHHPAKALHRHGAHELFLCDEGRCLQLTRRGAVENAPGELFFFPAGQDHNSNGIAGAACRSLVLNFPVTLFAAADEGDAAIRAVLRWLRTRALAGDNRVPLSTTGARAVGRAFAALVDEARAQRPGWHAALKLRTQELLLAVLRDERVLPALDERFRPGSAGERLQVALRSIEHRYADRLDVGRVAQEVGLGRSRFHEVFRAATGRTFVQHLAEVRVRAAERLLGDTDLPIAEVAAACGFSTVGRFYDVFRARRGTTPLRVRLAAQR